MTSLKKFKLEKIKMSDFKHVDTTLGFLNEVRNVQDSSGRARSIQVQRQTGILRPSHINGRL